MKMLGLKKFMAVAALAVAVVGMTGTRPATAGPVFNFAGICDLCDAALGGNGVSVTGTLKLSDSVVVLANNNFLHSDIDGFSLQFGPVGGISPIVFNFPVANTAIAGKFGSGTTIKDADFTDADGRNFQFSLGEGFDFFAFNITNIGDNFPPLKFDLAVPEPRSTTIFLPGLVGLLMLTRRRRRVLAMARSA